MLDYLVQFHKKIVTYCIYKCKLHLTLVEWNIFPIYNKKKSGKVWRGLHATGNRL